MSSNIEWIDRLAAEKDLPDEGFAQLLETINKGEMEVLFEKARAVREKIYGKDVFVRGLIEFTNICKNDCYYCGIRKSNGGLSRYRLTPEQILDCAREGYQLGFRTFVLQGGEDAWFTTERVVQIVRQIRQEFPDCAITLSIGERPRADYEKFYEAGAERYLLRHETADEKHYATLHPAQMSLANRKKCLFELREIGYQVGAGFMVGSPGQTVLTLISDLRFLQELRPHMIGIGPFLAHQDTPFAGEPDGSYERTLVLLGILRLMFPGVLLPATTALGTLDGRGRQEGVLSGCNVVMPNLSPMAVRKKYLLYDHKAGIEDSGESSLKKLRAQMQEIGYTVAVGRGDFTGRRDAQ